jgi:hypothetical protein
MESVFARCKPLTRWARQALAINRPLALLGFSMLALLPVLIVGILADSRAITGAPAWLKPAKFAISIAIYSLTLLWLLRYVRGHRWLAPLASIVIAVSLLVEEVIIVLQAARGTTSHFNVGTPVDAALWGTMGSLIVVVWLMTLLVGVLLIWQRFPDAAFAWALRLGVLISLLGMAVAFFMTQPTSAQRATARESGSMTVAGAHTVGAPDGGPGLPVVGWSTEAGDLRPAHFFGLHALQVLPMAAWLINRRMRLSSGRKLALVWTVGGLYAGLVVLMMWQALRGQALMAPDLLTLTALGSILGGTAIAALAIVVTGSGRPLRASALEAV